MFSIFKRTPKSEATPRAVTKVPHSGTKRSAPTFPGEELPLPEVVEGNEDADWAVWQDSVAFQDSQLPSEAVPAAPMPKTEEKPKSSTSDAFASVRKYTP